MSYNYCRKEYLCGDFLCDNIQREETVEDIAEKKINLLYDFCILRRNGRKPDAREATVRQILIKCGSEHKMTALLHGVLRDRCTIDDIICKAERSEE